MNDNEARQAAWSKLCRPELIGNDGTKLHRIDNFDAGWNAAAEHYKAENARLAAKLERAMEGLEHYADTRNWKAVPHQNFDPDMHHYYEPFDYDEWQNMENGSDHARNVLEEIKSL